MKAWVQVLLFVLLITMALFYIDHVHQCKRTSFVKHKHNQGSNLLPVLDPKFNMRQICKQCVLLEDHLAVPRLQCRDCIMKHFLYLEGYAEEAITLDTDNKYKDVLQGLPDEIRRLQDRFNADEDYHDIAQDLRKLRKRLIHDCFDMGGALGANKDGSVAKGAKTCGGGSSGTCGGGGGSSGTCGGGVPAGAAAPSAGSDGRACPEGPVQTIVFPVAERTDPPVPMGGKPDSSLRRVELPPEDPYQYVPKVLPEWVKLL